MCLYVGIRVPFVLTYLGSVIFQSRKKVDTGKKFSKSWSVLGDKKILPLPLGHGRGLKCTLVYVCMCECVCVCVCAPTC